MTVLISNNGEFSNGLKFEARDSGHALSHGPVYGSAGYLALRLDDNGFDTNVYLQSSTDGLNWIDQSHNITIPFASISNLTYANGIYFVLGTTPSTYTTKYISYSTDMSTWTNLTFTSAISGNVVNIVYSNNLYILLTNDGGNTSRIYTSTNLTTWTLRHSRTYGGGTVTGFAYTCIATSGTNTVVGGWSYHNTNNKYIPIYSYSSNGTTWTDGSINGGGTNDISTRFQDIVSTSGTSFIMVGTGGIIYTTSNMTSWTNQSTGTTSDLYKVGYANSKYVVYGGPSLVLTSSNGSTWTSQTLPQVQTDDILSYSNGAPIVSKPVYANSKWIVGDYTSTDAATWSVLDYQLPNKQPFIKYPYESGWNTWKSMDFWVFIPSHPNKFSEFGIASERGSWSVYLETQASGSVSLRYRGNNFSAYADAVITSSFNFGQWNHLRLVSDAGVSSWYLNGSRKSITTTGIRLVANDTLNIGYSAWVADNRYARPVDYFIDEFYLTDEALNNPNATSITVPTQPWVNNEYTSILLHFNTNFEDDPSTPARNGTAFIDATFTEVTNASKIVKTPVALSTTASQSASATKAVNTSASLSATATITASLRRTKQFSASLVVAASELTANARTRGFGAILTSTATVSAIPTKQFGAFTAALSATASLSGNLVKIKEFSANLVTTGSTLIADTRTRGDGANLTATVTLTASAVRTRRTAVALTTTATVTAQPNRIKQFSSNLVVGASELTVDQKTVRTSATLSTTAALSSTAKRTRSGTATISCQANIIVVASQSKINRVSLSSTSSLFVTTGNIKRTEAHLAVGAFEVTTARTINLDSAAMWTVPAESTMWKIQQETREWIIPYEERTYQV
jgi:hypothetical protein